MTTDKISQLSDDILHQILSFLNAKHAVQTSVLSRRWRYVWVSMHTLNLDFDSYPFEGPPDFDLKANSFKRFVYEFLSGDSCWNVRKFNYCFVQQDMSLDYEIIKGMLFHIFKRNIQDIVFYTSESLPADWRALLSACESLSEVNLIARYDVTWNSFNHIALTSLHLEDFDWQLCLEGDIISNCPNLETLVLKRFDLYNLRISAEKLRVLELSHVFFSSGSEIVLSTPRLMSLKVDYVGLLPSLYSIEDLPSIENIEILQAPEVFTSSAEWTWTILQNLINLFRSADNTRSLVLSLELAQLLPTVPQWLQHRNKLLPNLRQLKLKTNGNGGRNEPSRLLGNFYSSRGVNVEYI